MDLRAELAAMRAELPARSEPVPVATRVRQFRARRSDKRKRNIAILDMETDPFDNSRPDDKIFPFLAVLYSDQFDPIVIWENEHETFISRLLSAIRGLPDEYTIYAHNGGKFDFMFLVHRLRGAVSFKGRAIMSARIGNHELRDSFHILPEKLANMAKEQFDYMNMSKKRREACKDEIIKYCISDCENLFKFVRRFIDRYGFKISIGAASMMKLGEHYRVEKLAPSIDTQLRSFYMGGRVECIQGAGYFEGDFKLYDVNSMYPAVMAECRHPIGSEYIARDGKPNVNTIFLKIECENDGALLTRAEDGSLTADVRRGVFYTTKWEYETARDLDLIGGVKILECVDNFKFTTFEKFVTPLYNERAEAKALLDTLTPGTQEHEDCKAEVLFKKLILNNSYGKFAQNPRRYKDHFITDPNERPDIPSNEAPFDSIPEFMGADYWIWSRPSPKLRFNNVGTAASITGAARAKLMRAIHHATNPLYCDTDSLICESLRGHDLHHTRLGAWDMEAQIRKLIVCGKKLYAYEYWNAKKKSWERSIKSKGAGGVTWEDMLGLLKGETRVIPNKAPTLTRHGKQYYLSRRVSLTARPNAAPLPERAFA